MNKEGLRKWLVGERNRWDPLCVVWRTRSRRANQELETRCCHMWRDECKIRFRGTPEWFELQETLGERARQFISDTCEMRRRRHADHLRWANETEVTMRLMGMLRDIIHGGNPPPLTFPLQTHDDSRYNFLLKLELSRIPGVSLNPLPRGHQ